MHEFLYIHPIFGKGYSLTDIEKDGYCSLEKIYKDKSRSLCGDYLKNLKPDLTSTRVICSKCFAQYIEEDETVYGVYTHFIICLDCQNSKRDYK